MDIHKYLKDGNSFFWRYVVELMEARGEIDVN